MSRTIFTRYDAYEIYDVHVYYFLITLVYLRVWITYTHEVVIVIITTM